jgi:hypothetical protein
MQRIIEYDTVRIVRLVGSAESHLAVSYATRVPAVGDQGTVVDLTPPHSDPDDPTTQYIVESVEWLAMFSRDELELVIDPDSSARPSN